MNGLIAWKVVQDNITKDWFVVFDGKLEGVDKKYIHLPCNELEAAINMVIV